MQIPGISTKILEIFNPKINTGASFVANPPAGGKIKVGIFTFTCCEDSTIMLTEIMNDYLLEWLARIEFVEA